MIDELALIIFILCVCSYSILLVYRFRSKKPFKLTLYNLIYRDWVENRLKKNSEIATHNILRNFQMSNSTITSALFILLGIIIGIYPQNNGSELFWALISLRFVKIALNSFLIIFCILNFILSIRSITRLNLLISGDPGKYQLNGRTGIDAAKKSFIRAKSHWMMGIRGLFYLTATLFWFLSNYLFIIMTIGITLYFIIIRDVRKLKTDESI